MLGVLLVTVVVFGPILVQAQSPTPMAMPPAQTTQPAPAAPAGPNPKTDPFTQVAIPATDVAERVDKHYNKIHSLQLNFVERYTGMGTMRTEQGTLLLKKPGFMRWTYTHPKGKLFIISKKDAFAYTPGDAQAQHFTVDQLDDLRSPLRFLLGKTELARELSDMTVTTDGDRFILRGVPTAIAKRVTSLELTVTQDGMILAMRMVETGGAETRFMFYGENDKVDASNSDFDFQPPAGVKVVDALAPM